MRVTLISKALVVGAYQRKCELIARHPGIELTVLVPRSWRTGNQITHLSREHVDGYTLRDIPIWFNGSFHLHCYPTLKSELELIHPDVVHIDEEPYNLATYQALRFARSLKAKTLFFAWQNLYRHYPPPFNWMERYVLCNTDLAIAGSQEAAHILVSKGFTHQVMGCPQFGVDESVYTPEKTAKHSADRFLIGYAGRLVREKGVDLLINALTRLPDSVHLLIIGSGNQYHALQSQVTRLQLQARVHFTNEVSSTQMPMMYRQMDVLVLPSRTQANWKEQFGRVLIEAMACGVPVIGSACGEIPNVIADAGLIFAEGNTDQLHNQLHRLYHQPELRLDLSERGRARVLAKYTMQIIADITVEAYRKLVQ